MPAFKIRSANHLRRKSPLGHSWETAGNDPHFSIELVGGPYPPGRYWLTSVGGKDLDKLQSPVIYLDIGEGFREEDKRRIAFVPDGAGEFRALLTAERPLHAMRFDPTDLDIPQQFSLRLLGLEPFPPRERVRTSNGLPLKVLINLVRLLPAHGGAGGAGRFCIALLEYLPDDMDVRCAIPPHHSELMGKFPLVDFVVCHADDNAHLAQHLAWCDCYVDPLNALRPTSIDPGVATISVVHDLQHMRMPWFFSEAEIAARRREYAYAIGRSNHLIAFSHYERQNLETYFDRRDVEVVYHTGYMAEASERDSNSQRKTAAAKQRAQEPYLLYPAVPWPHKNHEGLVQAVGILKRRGHKVPVVLTNTSGNSEGGKRITRLIELLQLEKIVDRKGFLPEADLHALFRNATGMVFPSLYEGFGIPLVDAMKMEVPVLAARNTAAAEVGGDSCAYFSNIENVLSVADDIAQFWNDSEARNELKRKGKVRGQDFSSRKMVDAMAIAIRAAIEAKKAGCIPSSAVELRNPEFSETSVCLLLERSDATALAQLRAEEDIHRFLSGRLGTDDVVILMDLSLLDDDELVRKLRAVPKLITYDSRKRGALDFAVEEFDIRYNCGLSSMVLTLQTLIRHDAADFRRLRDALMLFGEAHAASLVPGIRDCIVTSHHSEIDRVLGYESMRRSHYALTDILVKRDAKGGLKNGTAAFLNHFVSGCRVVHVPQSLAGKT